MKYRVIVLPDKIKPLGEVVFKPWLPSNWWNQKAQNGIFFIENVLRHIFKLMSLLTVIVALGPMRGYTIPSKTKSVSHLTDFLVVNHICCLQTMVITLCQARELYGY